MSEPKFKVGDVVVFDGKRAIVKRVYSERPFDVIPAYTIEFKSLRQETVHEYHLSEPYGLIDIGGGLKVSVGLSMGEG